MIRQMPFKLSLAISSVSAVFKDRADLVAENIALRHQLSCFIHRESRPKLRPVDRCRFSFSVLREIAALLCPMRDGPNHPRYPRSRRRIRLVRGQIFVQNHARHACLPRLGHTASSLHPCLLPYPSRAGDRRARPPTTARYLRSEVIEAEDHTRRWCMNRNTAAATPLL